MSHASTEQRVSTSRGGQATGACTLPGQAVSCCPPPPPAQDRGGTAQLCETQVHIKCPAHLV